MSIGKLLATALTVLSLSAPAMAAQQVVINGSTTVLPVVQKAGEAFMASHPDVELSISGGGSGNGIKALIEKQCDIAMSSRDIKEKEVEAAKKNGVTPNRVVVAIDAIVPVVNPANPGCRPHHCPAARHLCRQDHQLEGNWRPGRQDRCHLPRYVLRYL